MRRLGLCRLGCRSPAERAQPSFRLGYLCHRRVGFPRHSSLARLEEIFGILDKPAREKKCPAIEGIIEEASEIMKEAEDDTVRDAGMLAAAQAVEHYEISRYH